MLSCDLSVYDELFGSPLASRCKMLSSSWPRISQAAVVGLQHRPTWFDANSDVNGAMSQLDLTGPRLHSSMDPWSMG